MYYGQVDNNPGGRSKSTPGGRFQQNFMTATGGHIFYSPTEVAKADFIDRLSGGYGGSGSTSTSFDSGLAKDRGALDAWKASKGPTAGQNRFETGLASSEKRLSNLLDDPNSIQQSAAYKFRVGQGEEALNRNLAAKGMAGSGNRLTELNDYAQGQASQEYGNQFGRLKDLTGMYAGNWNQDMSSLRQAHNQKGNTLANIYGTTAGAVNQATQIQQQNQNQLLNSVMSWK